MERFADTKKGGVMGRPKYINSRKPEVKLPGYPGQKYEVMVPDTLDLADMAGLGVNGLTGPTDPEADYEIYWRAAFNANRKPIMWHVDAPDTSILGKFVEALPLLRLVSGSDQDRHVEQRWLEVIRQMQGPDGLFYASKIGRPWCVWNYSDYVPLYGGKETPGDYCMCLLLGGRSLGAMTIYFLLTGDPEWKNAGKKFADGVEKLAVADGKKAHLPLTDDPDAVFADRPSALNHKACIQELANFARHTGYEPALDSAGRLTRWVIEDFNYYGPDGHFLPEHPDHPNVHFHGHTGLLVAILDYGIISGDKDAVDFAHRGFRYGMTKGECLLGYFPEWLYAPFTVPSEICEVAEMIALGVKLSKSGVGDYWDMVERWVRNLFCEAQVKREYQERLYWLAARIPATHPSPMEIPPYYSTDRVIERNTGAFVSTLGANDLLPGEFFYMGSSSDGIAHCCTGNAARAIYYVWENTVTHETGNLKVNLLLNRASQWADIDSHLPYAGQVDVKVKKSVELSVRLPEWVKPEQAKCTVNTGARTLRSSGRYAVVGKVAPGDLVTLSFPIEERTEHITVEKRTYRILMRGNTCVAIGPSGENVPLFHRDHFRSDTTRWRKVTRFLGKDEIEW